MSGDPLPFSLTALLDREAENTRQIASARAMLEKLETENKRIADALALLKEIGAVPEDAAPADTTPKTLPDMIFAVVRELGPSTGAEIIRVIRERWKEDAHSENVRPTLWRLVQASRLKKRGDRYDLP